jgi:hypothetical protein
MLLIIRRVNHETVDIYFLANTARKIKGIIQLVREDDHHVSLIRGNMGSFECL